MPKFERKTASTKEEKLILELSDNLLDTMKVFINLNKFTSIDEEIFVVLRDGSMSYVALVLEFLAGMLANKQDTPRFISEARDIFECYMQQLYEKGMKK